MGRGLGGLVDGMQRNGVLLGEVAAGFVFGGEAGGGAQLGQDAGDVAPGGCHGEGLAGKFAALRGPAADAKRGRFLEDDLFQALGVRFGAQDRQRDAGPVFLHRDGGRVNVESAGLPEPFDAVTDKLARHVIQVRFQHHDAVGFERAGR